MSNFLLNNLVSSSICHFTIFFCVLRILDPDSVEITVDDDDSSEVDDDIINVSTAHTTETGNADDNGDDTTDAAEQADDNDSKEDSDNAVDNDSTENDDGILIHLFLLHMLTYPATSSILTQFFVNRRCRGCRWR